MARGWGLVRAGLLRLVPVQHCGVADPTCLRDHEPQGHKLHAQRLQQGF